jgi:hypothetical protein
MTIKQTGGIFGRNPSFKTATTESLVVGDQDVTKEVQRLNVQDQSTVSVAGGATEDLYTFNIGTYKQCQFYRIEIFTEVDIITGGGEHIVLELGMATGGSSVGHTLTEIYRTRVNGPGGSSDDPPALTVSTTTNTVTVTITGGTAGGNTLSVKTLVYPMRQEDFDF